MLGKLTGVVIVMAVALAACGDNLEGVENGAPQVGSLELTTEEDTPVSGTLSVTDAEGDDITIMLGNPMHGTITQSGGMVTYTPDADYNGTDSVMVAVSDGTLEASATITITITAVNDAPQAVADSFATGEDVALEVERTALTANDTDVDGDTLTVSVVDMPVNGTVAIVGTDVVFTPTPDFNGTASFRYTITDGNATSSATVNVTVGGANDAPVAVDDTATTPEDTALVISSATLVANDTDAENQTLTVTAVANLTNGTVALAGGNVTFTPTTNFNGTATFQYTVSDGAATDTGVVTVTVTAVNDAPVAVDDTATTPEDTAITLSSATLTANDTDVDAGQTLVVTAATSAVNGTVSIDANGAVTFTPTANFSGTGSFVYTVSDGNGGTDTATVTITIGAVGDAPVVGPDSVTTNEDTAINIAAATLLANDSDPDGETLTLTAVSNPTNGTVSLANNIVTFTPAANFNGMASFQYTVSDGSTSSTGLVTVTVTAVNDPPVAVNDTASAASGAATSYPTSQFLANDTDIDGGTLVITAVSNPSNGTVALNGTTITYQSASTFVGTATFDYTLSDGNGGTDTGTVSVTVLAPSSCGDGLITGPESCDDGGVIPTGGDGCDANCAIEPGFQCAGQPSICQEVCGDGIITSGEACDDDNTAPGDGCSDQCAIEFGFQCAGQPSICQEVCGDGIITGGEACDDDNTASGDGCSDQCALEPGFQCAGQPTICQPICGDGIIAGDESCDDDNTSPGDGCSDQCEVEAGFQCAGQPSICQAICGDGIIAGGESCDDDGTDPGDGCSAQCAVESGFQCAGQPSICQTVCGDGVVTSDEQCDDDNDINTDGCTNECTFGVVCNATAYPGGTAFTVDPVSGTCYVAFAATQTFADAQASCVASGGYLATITSGAENTIVRAVEAAGQNPWIGAFEDANDVDDVFTWVTGEAFAFKNFATGQPDDDVLQAGNGDCLHIVNDAGQWNDTNCTFAGFVTSRICEFELAPCGDNVLQTSEGEACDDGNTANGDGCSATCTVESGAVCSGTAPTTCAKLVINEIEYDNIGTDSSEFIEIFNAGTASADLTNHAVVLANGGVSPAVQYGRINLSGTLAPGAYALICPANSTVGNCGSRLMPVGTTRFLFTGSTDQIQNGASDAIGLFVIVGTTATPVDVVSYEGTLATAQITGVVGTSPFVEGTGIVTGEDNVIDVSVQRLPNARDTQNNNADFALRAPTPGAPTP
ncbi:MAG: tandem-95 repeat protein [Deltaproteobacteria bacterium]|nr:tandem-95 repeat protein [Deltaproteobacteria bacterium]MDQ3296779.1 Ig-like domain-containing protein [Myxococcota bacterium]